MVKNTTDYEQIGKYVLETASLADAQNGILDRLGFYYCHLVTGKTKVDFYEEVLIPIRDSSPSAPAKFDFKFAKAKASYRGYISMLLDSCTTVVMAHDAEKQGQNAEAWQCIGNAMYLLGRLEGTILHEKLIEHVVRSTGLAARNKVNEKREPLRQFARNLASQGQYSDASEATEAIVDQVVAESLRLAPVSKFKFGGADVPAMRKTALRRIPVWLIDQYAKKK